MKFRIALAALAAAVLLATVPLQSGELQKRPKKQKTATTTVTVYITKTGKKYHRDGCASLSRSKIPTTLEQAKRSYGPCSKCNPPQ